MQKTNIPIGSVKEIAGRYTEIWISKAKWRREVEAGKQFWLVNDTGYLYTLFCNSIASPAREHRQFKAQCRVGNSNKLRYGAAGW